MATGTVDVQLNVEQKKAVTYGDGPLLIVAGAGTGKTTVITQRILWLIKNKKATSEEMLALTFTDKAAGEMVDRIDQLLPYGYIDLWVSTFHSFCERILKHRGIDIGIPNDFRLVNETDAWFLVRKHLDRFALDYYRPLGNPTKFIHALLKHFSRCKDEDVGPKEYVEYAKGLKLDADNADRADNAEIARVQELANAYHVYQQILLENNALDFGDLLLYTLKLFRERPAILKNYQNQFRYILVDEFQDTNWVQYELVKFLAAPRNNLTVVADDDQAIYQWRGASVSNVLRFKDDYPKSEQIVLLENYRSYQNILDLAYAFIQHNNPYRLEYRLSTVDAIVKHAKERGVTVKGFKPIQKKLKAMAKGEGAIEHLHGATAEEEARMVVERISHIAKSKSQKTNWNDFAILVRANHEADIFTRALEAAGIPYQFLASTGLYAKPVVVDLVSYLRLLDDYHESAAVYRVLQWPHLALPQEDIITLLAYARRKSQSLYEVLKHSTMLPSLSEATQKRIAQLLHWIENHRQLVRAQPVGRVLYTVLEDTGYLKDLLHRSKIDRRALEAVSHLRQLFKKIEEFERTQEEKTVQQFIAFLNLALESGEEGSLENDVEEGPETVKILTVHGAKGLEFLYVFIVNLVELRFPSMNRKDPIELPDALVKEIVPEGDVHLQEERRLFYVAITRAKEGVFFTSADDYGGTRKKRLSRFLVEAEIVDKSKVKGQKSKVQSNLHFPIPAIKESQAGSRRFKASNLPAQFSFTQLKAFETCPYQYRFAHILKIPVRGRYTFSFGRTMHTTLQRFFQKFTERSGKEQGELFSDQRSPHQSARPETLEESPEDSNRSWRIGTGQAAISDQRSVPTLEELLKIYDESWIDDWYESKKHKEEYREKGRSILTEFYKQHTGEWPSVAYLEKSFTIKIGSSMVKGVIDRIDLVDREKGQIEIVDYKTGKPPAREADIEKDQLLIYHIAAKEVFHQEPVRLSYYYLNEQKKFSFLGTDAELQELKAKIQTTIHDIQTSDFPATPSPFKCRHCDFKEICEYRQL